MPFRVSDFNNDGRRVGEAVTCRGPLLPRTAVAAARFCHDPLLPRFAVAAARIAAVR
jgi:hypothetical protein